jgi:predicted permease
VLARPLPWPDADRIVRVDETREGSPEPPRHFTNVAYNSWKQAATTIAHIGAYSHMTLTVDAGAGPERVDVAPVTASLFDVMGVRPARGRAFTADEELADDVAVLSHGFWTRRFGGDEAAIGRTLTVGGKSRTIVGVMPPRFDFPSDDIALWTPMRVQPLQISANGQQLSLQMFASLARLAPGATPEAAAAEATTAVRAGPSLGMVGTAVFGSNGPAVVHARKLQDVMTSEVRSGVLLLLAGVALLFATSTAGLATLQVARAVARRREVAIRAAIGAGTGRLARQLVIEHLVVGAIGGLAGLALAAGLHQALPAMLPADFPRLDDIVLDWRLALFGAALAIAASLVAALFPALQAGRLRLVTALVEQSLAPIGGRLRTPALRLRAGMIVAQIAITVVLLVGAGLLGRSFIAMMDVDRGYDPVNLLTARLPIEGTTIPATGRAEVLDRITARLETTPGVRAVGYGVSAPFMPGYSMLGFRLRATESRTGQARSIQAHQIVVSAGYGRALGLRVVDGRDFTEADAASREPVVIVNREFARSYLREPAVGLVLPLGATRPGGGSTVIGVVDNIAPSTLDEAAGPQIFRLVGHTDDTLEDIKLIVRTAGDPTIVAPVLRSIVKAEARGLPVESVVTMSDRLSESLARPRLYALLLGAFAGFALLVAGIGLFGVLAHGVSARRRELGVRLALGATPTGLVGLVVRQSLALTVPGLVIGAATAALLAASAASMLFGVTPRDPMTYVSVTTIVVAVVGLAAYVPARRAAGTDPTEALRH